jgi:hypothetical protein
MDKFSDLQGLLSWLIYSGGAILVASWVLDRIAAYQDLKAETKRLVNMIVSAALALGAFAIITYVPADVFVMLDPWFKVILGTIVLYSGQQVVHSLTKTY